MLKTIAYSRVPLGSCLGRNRYSMTGGLDIYEGGTPEAPEIHLTPRTSKGQGSDACRIVIPTEAIGQVAETLLAFAPKVALPEEPSVFPPGRFARLVARWRGGPYPAIG